jgi:hypothetical protein
VMPGMELPEQKASAPPSPGVSGAWLELRPVTLLK